ncbi:MAG: Ig-like domain-containing protein [Monoglobales bacterium]
MKKNIALFTVIACFLLQLALVTSVSAADPVFAPVVLDFEDYQDEFHPAETVEQYLTRKGWADSNIDHAEIVTVNGNKRIKYTDTSNLYYEWNDPETNYTDENYPNKKMVVESTFKFEYTPGKDAILAGANFPGVLGNADLTSPTSTNNRMVNTGLYFSDTQGGYDFTTRGTRMGWADTNAAILNSEDISLTHILYYDEGSINGGAVQKIWNDDNQKLNCYFNKTGNTEVKRLTFDSNKIFPLYLDDIRAYLVDKTFTANTPAFDGGTNVSVDTDFTLSFNNPVFADTLENITITANGQIVDPSLYSITPTKDSNGLYTKAKVEFVGGAAFGTEYAITIPTTVKDTARQNLSEEKVVTFTTEGLPNFNVTVSAYKGLSTSGTAITSLSAADNKTITCVVNAANLDNKAYSPFVFAALYDSSNNLVKFVCAKKSFEISGSNSLTFSMSLPESGTGYKLKAFVCANLFEMTPFGNVYELPWE